MKKPSRRPYCARDLAKAARVSKRSLSRWFAQGILGPAPRRGPGVTYSEEQILRARAAATLRQELSSLDDIRRRLDGATRAELLSWADGADPASTVTTFPAVHYEHVELAPGLTLIVRADCDPAVRRLAQEIHARYGPVRR